MMILAIDLGKLKSVACADDAGSGGHAFTTLPATPRAPRDLPTERRPRRGVIEVGSAAGRVRDLG